MYDSSDSSLSVSIGGNKYSTSTLFFDIGYCWCIV